MSGLTDAAKAAREHADGCINPACHGAANALEDAVAAEAREQLSELAPDHGTEGIPTPQEAGYVTEVRIPRGGVEN